MSGEGVEVAVILVYGIYVVLAVLALRAAWRRTEAWHARRRSVVRSMVIALLFAPALLGFRIAPFLLATVATFVVDLISVRPLTLAWAATSLLQFTYFMLFPFLVTWGIAYFVIEMTEKTKR